MAAAKQPAPKKDAAKTPADGVPALHPDHIAALVGGRHPRPHDALGQHPATIGGVDGFVIRAVRPLAETVTAVQKDGTRVPLEHVADGLWQGFAPGPGQAYVLETGYAGAPSWTAA
ncbi:MAG: 1,4-alpha-glucan branching enzyme, partial [Leifsonia sp.]